MDDYNTVLVPVDVFSDYSQILSKALRVAPDPKNVHLLYVAFPQTNVEPYGLFLERDYSQDVQEQAMTKLKDLSLIHI